MSTRIKVIGLLATMGALPFTAFAAVSTACTLFSQLFTVVKLFGTVVLVVAIAMLLYAGFLFMTGSGNEETIKKAKSFLIYALIGIAVALLASSARFLVANVIPGGEILTECLPTGA